MNFDHKKFFDGFKEDFDASLDQDQVDGIEFLLTSFETNPLWKDVRHIAYALGTVYHETATSMQPVEEGYYLGSASRVKSFQKTLRYSPYFGRGYVQLTWSKNYTKAGKALGLDLNGHPELALVKENAFPIMTLGMFQGWFTGKKFSDYIHGSTCDYVNARRMINGTDKAGLIAGYARKFEQILKVSTAVPIELNSDDTPSSTGNVVDDSNTTASDTSGQPSDLPQAAPSNATVTETTIDSATGTTVATTTTSDNTQDVNVPATVETHLYQGTGFIGALKKDFAVVGGGNLSFQTLQEYATDASGWPPWVIAVVTKLATVVIIIGVGWLVFRLFHYTIWKISEWRRQSLEATINSDTSKKNISFT